MQAAWDLPCKRVHGIGQGAHGGIDDFHQRLVAALHTRDRRLGASGHGQDGGEQRGQGAEKAHEFRARVIGALVCTSSTILTGRLRVVWRKDPWTSP